MKYQLSLALVAALCFLGVSCDETPEATTAAAAAAAVEEQTTAAKGNVCEPGAVVEVQCNTCVCSSDGSELACTKKICIGLEEGDVKPQNLPAPLEEEVKPQNLPAPLEEEVKAQNLPAPLEEEVKAQNLPAPDAEPSKAETEIPAVAKDRRRRRRRDADEGVCEPGQNFKRDCNECVCPESGKKSEALICTIIACPDS